MQVTWTRRGSTQPVRTEDTWEAWSSRAILSHMAPTNSGGAPSPLEATFRFCRTAQPGPVLIDVDVEHQGRTVQFIRARARQDGISVALAETTLARRVAEAASGDFDDGVSPDLLPPDTYEPIPVSRRFPVSAHFEARPAEAPSEPRRPAMTTGWLSMVDPSDLDHCGVTALLDAWPLAVFRRFQRPVPISTLVFTVFFRDSLVLPSDPVSTPRPVRFQTLRATSRFIEEDGELWSTTGQLIAQSRQIILLRL